VHAAQDFQEGNSSAWDALMAQDVSWRPPTNIQPADENGSPHLVQLAIANEERETIAARNKQTKIDTAQRTLQMLQLLRSKEQRKSEQKQAK